MPNEKQIAKTYFVQSEPAVLGSIATFLSKPQIIYSGNFAPTDTSSTFTPIQCPSVIIQNAVFREKLSGYYGFRATMCFRLQVNGNRFQQGRYMLTYIPTGGARVGTGTAGEQWINLHANTLRARSQLPHAEIDINCDTECNLRIPFNSTVDFYRVQNLYNTGILGNWGVLRLYPYQVINSTSGPVSCGFTLWAHFEDLELIGNDAPIIAQMGGFATAGRKSKKSLSETEGASSGVGSLQSMAMKVSKAMGYMAPVPMLTNFTSPVKWSADIVANVASVFGWSAPLNMEHVQRMGRNVAAYSTNIDKVDQSLPLSLTTENAVSVMPGFSGSNKDELDIAYLCGIPTYHSTTTWADTAVPGDQLFTFGLTPVSMTTNRSYLTQSVSDMSPFSYVASKFAYWRSGFTFTFKLIKTEFHSGRIAIVFYPEDGRSANTNTFTYANTTYLQRDIVDIRECNELSITVPYISPFPYKVTTERFGTLRIFVVDPLVAPSTVPSSINIITEVSATPDVEFAGLRNQPYVVATGISAQSSGMMSDSSTCAIVNKTIGTMNEGNFQLNTSEATIGEKVLSLRSLLKRFFTFRARNDTPPTFSKSTTFIPFGFQGGAVAPATNAITDYANDLYGELAAIFLYSRGGVRLKFQYYNQKISSADVNFPIASTSLTHIGSSSGTFNNVMTHSASPAGLATQKPSWYYARDSTAFSSIEDEKFVEVQVPQYGITHSRNNIDHLVGGANSVGYVANTTTLATPWVVSTMIAKDDMPLDVDIKVLVMRAGADDVNFGGFVSIPPMFVPGT
jgi:hypothetical protein